MDDSFLYNADVPLEIVVVHRTTEVRESKVTTSSILEDEESSSSSSVSSSSFYFKPLPSNIVTTFQPVLLPIPSKEMMESRWESSPQSEKCKHAQTQLSPRLPRRNRTQPLECSKELFQIETETQKKDKTNSTTDVNVVNGGHRDDAAIQRAVKRTRDIVRTKSDGETMRKNQSSPLSSKSEHVKRSW
jgi:hypothetical protein